MIQSVSVTSMATSSSPSTSLIRGTLWPLVAEFDAASYAALADEARQALAFCETGDGRVEIPTVAHIVTARRP